MLEGQLHVLGCQIYTLVDSIFMGGNNSWVVITSYMQDIIMDCMIKEI